ncbi:VWA domain-containing protein [Vibrio kyushuensis]|uniref:VWA domain-containing protein n=1 Tax=Vibrio kyushuensis TaxID=2910249 RepID=UPI003D0FC49D
MSDFTFLYPFWLIAIIPTIGLIIWLKKSTHQASLIAPHLAKAIGLDAKPRKRSVIYFIGIGQICTIIALAGPSFYSSERPVYSNSGGRIVVMDMSLSMYATDIKPNRLTQARYKVTDLLNLWNEGSTGLVAYAGDAYTVSPMTTDSQTLLNLLPNLSPDIMPYPGADAAAGVALAIEMMQNAGLDQGDIILVADDIDNDEKQAISKMLRDTQWKLSILSVATPSGSPIRLNDGALLRDDNGTTVIAQSNFSNMKALIRSVDGVFTSIHADSRDIDAINTFTSRVEASSSLQNQQLEERVNSGYWLLPLLIVPISLLFRRGVIFSIAVLGLSLVQPNVVHASPWKTSDQQAIDLYEAKEYQQAAETFSDGEWKGVAQYKAGEFEGAINSFKMLEGDQALYNLANAQAQNGDFEQAIDNYNQLINNGKFVDEARENIEVVKRAQQQQKQDQQDQSNSDEDSQSDKSDSSSNDGSDSSQPSQPNTDPENSGEQSDNQQNNDSEGNNSDSSDGENNSDGQDTPEQNNAKANDDNEQNDQSSQANSPETSKENNDQNEQQANPSEATAAHQDNQQQVDPDIRKLEQVESARDPSRLLQAQMILQAKQKQPPQNSGKKW